MRGLAKRTHRPEQGYSQARVWVRRDVLWGAEARWPCLSGAPHRSAPLRTKSGSRRRLRRRSDCFGQPGRGRLRRLSRTISSGAPARWARNRPALNALERGNSSLNAAGARVRELRRNAEGTSVRLGLCVRHAKLRLPDSCEPEMKEAGGSRQPSVRLKLNRPALFQAARP